MQLATLHPSLVTRRSSLAKRLVTRTISHLLSPIPYLLSAALCAALLCAAPAIGADVQVRSWDELSAALANPDASDVIPLGGDIARGDSTASLAVPSGRTATLDLCGYILDGNGCGVSVLTVEGTLNLRDSSYMSPGQSPEGTARRTAAGSSLRTAASSSWRAARSPATRPQATAAGCSSRRAGRSR